MKKLYEDRENRICLLIFAVTIVAAIAPLISRYCLNGHDLEYHLLRIESLKEGILIGKPFLKVNTLFFGGAGYASSMFYSDLFLYIPAILRVLGVSIGTSYHIYAALMIILCYISTLYCTFKITDSKIAGSIAAVLVTLCPYHMFDTLERAACGEYMAFMFIPFVIYGIYNVVYEQMDRPWVFALGFGGLILSHPATLFMNVILCILVFVIYIRRFIKNPIVLVRLFITTIVTLLATSFFWLPMLEQMMTDSFYVSVDIPDMLDSSLHFYEIFANPILGVGAVLACISVLRIFIGKDDAEYVRYIDVLLILGIMFAFGSTNIMPWERLSRYLSFVQFPWRLFTMSTALIAVADAGILLIIAQKYIPGKLEILLGVIAIVSVCLAFAHSVNNVEGYYDYGNDYYSYKPFTANVIGGEWLPVRVIDREALVALSECMLADNGTSIPFERRKAIVTAEISEDVNSVDVPFIYYKGYVATITDGSGETYEYPVTGDGLNGMCRVYTNRKPGQLKVWYKGTLAATVSVWVSVVTWITLCVIWFYRRRNEKVIKGDE